LALSTATIFGAMASKTADRGVMQQVIDTASRTPTDAIATGATTGQFSDPASSFMTSGRAFLSTLFGGNSNWAADLIGREAGLGAGATATMMAVAGHSLLNYIGSRVRDSGMNATSLAEFINNEAPAMRRMLPPSFEDAFGTYFPKTTTRNIDVNPVVAQGVQKQRSLIPWVAAAAVLAGALTYGWYGMRHSRMMEPLPTRPIGAVMPRAVPTVPTAGTIERLRFDSVRFDTGRATLKPQSHAELVAAATALKAQPNARVQIAGYTDNVGSPAANLKLSEARANTVRNELIGMGVDGDRLSAQGYGEANPVADNSTEAGRAMNRRISMLVIEK
jgi:outer membrane protein OmpA-like peptidoglycan-associated protein